MKSGRDHIGLGCGAIIQNDAGQILLIRRSESIDKSRSTVGMWSAVGGEVDFCERTEDAVVREVKEEIGVGVEVIKFIGCTDQILSRSNLHWHLAHFLCKIIDGDPRIMESRKISQIEWFEPSDLPEDCGIHHVIRPLRLLGWISESEYRTRLRTTRES